jgi:hypothetical protein
METRKQMIVGALDAFVRQRSGMDPNNYSDGPMYRAEQRSITRDLHDYRVLARTVELRDSITADNLAKAFKAFSGRLTLPEGWDKPGFTTEIELDYCTGQYFPTEYRKAACAVLASALWEHSRAEMPQGERDPVTSAEIMPGNWQSPGDWLRASFRKEFGRGIASRWFS